MKQILRRMESDVRNMRHIEAYAVAGVGLVLAIVNLLGNAVGNELKWSTVFAGLSVVVYRTALPQEEDQACACTPLPEGTVIFHIDPTVRVVVVRSTPHATLIGEASADRPLPGSHP